MITRVLPALLVAALCLPGGSPTEPCPSVCACKWKSGKQTVECTGRGLITIPAGIGSDYQVLDVSGNNLQILPREMFVRAGLLNLQRVYLRNCKIGQIDDGAFAGLSNLVELDLSQNLLTSVPSNLFEDVPFLRDLSLASNPIQKVDGHAFRTVPGLVKLDLSHCQLQTIAPKAFDGVELLEALKLNGNRLRQLRPKTVETLSRLHGVELHDNPWYCDCHLRAAKLWLMDNNIPYPVAPTCRGGPDRLLDRSFSELQVDDFACKPIIRPDSRHMDAVSGENATIVCRVDSTPAAHISWYWNGRLLLNNSAFSSYQRVYVFETGHLEKRSSLVLTNAQEADSGDFYCVAENRAGSTEGNYTLHVSPRLAGMATLGGGQIAGLSAALVVLILFILLVILLLLVRLRRVPFSETKTPGNRPDALANGSVIGPQPAVHPAKNSTIVSNPAAATVPANHIQNLDIDRKIVPGELSLNMTGRGGTEPDSSNPDLINDTRRQDGDPDDPEAAYPAPLWDEGLRRAGSAAGLGGFCYPDADDRTPIVDGGYPPDYGLPVVPPSNSSGSPVDQHPSAKTLRVWQRGVPVLPPVTALKRVLSRSSPDEGYQEGCGTDV